jgi:hypothetical protein
MRRVSHIIVLKKPSRNLEFILVTLYTLWLCIFLHRRFHCGRIDF